MVYIQEKDFFYISAYRTRRTDTRVGTLYMVVPKLRNGLYVPFL